ncbi:MAG: hypothetical protein U0872_01290 [Planctomycetaceae bacterium]
MSHLPNQLIRGYRLYPAEEEKLERLSARLNSVFVGAGYADVRICEGAGLGEERQISFHRESDRSRLISFTSLAFLGSTGEELMNMISQHLRGIRKT